MNIDQGHPINIRLDICPAYIINTSLVPRLLRRGESLVHFITCVMSRVITHRWTKLGAQARSSTSILKTTTVFFSGRYGFSVLPSSFQSAIYSCPRRTSQFLESGATTRTTTTLAYKSRSSCHSACLVALSDTLRIYYTGVTVKCPPQSGPPTPSVRWGPLRAYQEIWARKGHLTLYANKTKFY